MRSLHHPEAPAATSFTAARAQRHRPATSFTHYVDHRPGPLRRGGPCGRAGPPALGPSAPVPAVFTDRAVLWSGARGPGPGAGVPRPAAANVATFTEHPGRPHAPTTHAPTHP